VKYDEMAFPKEGFGLGMLSALWPRPVLPQDGSVETQELNLR